MKILFRAWSVLSFRAARLTQRCRSSYWRYEIKRWGGVAGRGFQVKKGAFIDIERGASVEIGDNVIMAEGAAVYVGAKGRLVLEEGVFLGRGSVLISNERVTIGRGTQIAHYVTIIDTDHRFDGKELPLLNQGKRTRPISIGREAWIGAQSVILKGRTLGDHCVVGAGSVVSRDVAPGSRVVGNPAKDL